MSNYDPESNAVLSRNLIKDLSRHLTNGLRNQEASMLYKKAIIRLAEFEVSSLDNSTVSETDEFTIIENIKKILISSKDDTAITLFDSCHRKLLRTGVIQNRTAILNLLLHMSDAGRKPPSRLSTSASKPLSAKTSSGYFSRASQSAGVATNHSDCVSESMEQIYPPGGHHLSMESVASWSARSSRFETSRPPSSLGNRTSQRSVAGRFEVSETVLIQELILCFQGIEGKVIKADSQHGFKLDPLARVEQPHIVRHLMELGYLHNRVRALCCRGGHGGQQGGTVMQGLVCGIRNQLTEYYRSVANLHSEYFRIAASHGAGLPAQQGARPVLPGGPRGSAGGTVMQGLVCGIRNQLTEYYRSVANLHSELQQATYLNEDSPMCEEAPGYSCLSLCRLLVWAQEPLHTLQCLCDVAQACNSKTGGAVISCTQPFLDHGDPFRRDRCTFLLTSALRPLFTLICHWMADGELLDPHNEFFVYVNQSCPAKDRWHNKFRLREELVPSVMSRRQAELVLNTGKCTHFLNDICDAEEQSAVTGCRLQLKQMEDAKGDDMLELLDPSSEIWNILEGAFLETSKMVLDVLVNKYKLFEHFRGLRLYMLLGQGDFYRYFLELVHPELKKSAVSVYHHNLMAIMETAMRQTNAQFEDPDILSKVSVKLLVASGGEDGWDIFNMSYNVASPLDTIFCTSEQTYSQMFNFLWRLKRVNLGLSHTWKKQSLFLKRINRHRKQFSDMITATVQVRILTGEMVHYLHQVEYYIMFEVLECAWSAFSSHFQQAVSLEEVITAHQTYLAKIMAMTFQDTDNQKFSTQFRIINELVLELNRLADDFLACADAEFERKMERVVRIEQHGCDHLEAAEHLSMEESFCSSLLSFRARTRLLTQSYQDVLKKLLLDLSSHAELNLQFLSSRLDFNEFYKRSDARLSESMKFRRCSDYVTFARTPLAVE
ncbi:gamma-tubulin complex component 3 [Nilaparvata lugens]|uniref:gamma-tubulin complex component 3 n=1 Tax=Nilaparvata lugens TaxID=108931 RepID=UPI00193DA9B1|nr:gamma-tubulin complex component 3 [Nilaparvata lugens]